jgi:hypothetical protein
MPPAGGTASVRDKARLVSTNEFADAIVEGLAG